MKIMTLLASIVMLSGCVGTIISRGDPKGNVFGSYPYSGVVIDIKVASLVGHDVGCCSGSNYTAGFDYALFGILSLPLDICIDTILMPVDFVAWSMGKKKTEP